MPRGREVPARSSGLVNLLTMKLPMLFTGYIALAIVFLSKSYFYQQLLHRRTREIEYTLSS
jgi:hypothetical protein